MCRRSPFFVLEQFSADAERRRQAALDVVNAVRRSKAGRGLSVAVRLSSVRVTASEAVRDALESATRDPRSVSRAQRIDRVPPAKIGALEGIVASP